ncbi:hypothetical protein MNV49_004657 [Pseudohyphozyma bogoriensis]|nr:hypothetical protein MNV49_004657 [Pseudohyphozyma bogoriensis]
MSANAQYDPIGGVSKHSSRSWRSLTAVVLAALIGTAALYATHLPSRLSRPSESSDTISNRPAWNSVAQIRRLTRPVDNVAAPRRLSHLTLNYTVQPPFDAVWVVSAYLDTRPLVAEAAPDLVVLGATRLFDDVDDVTNVPEWQRFHCHIAMREHGKRDADAVYWTEPAIVQKIPDSHPGEKTYFPAQWTCNLRSYIGRSHASWNSSEIFVSISPLAAPPPPSAFLPVTVLAPLPEDHASGEGPAVMCVQPLVSDTYANSLGDWVDYYHALGISKFSFYLLDPGPLTLGVLSDLAAAYPHGSDAGIEIAVHRWALSKTWITSLGKHLVDPRDWGLEHAGLFPMDDELEAEFGFPTRERRTKDLVEIWAFAQGLALHDCKYREMVRSTRWVAHFDLDEYLLLRPPSGVWPPPQKTDSAFTNWALTSEGAANGHLPIGYTFHNAFTCISCLPSTRPVETPATQELAAMGGSVLTPSPAWPLIFSSPVRTVWYKAQVRAKSVLSPWGWWLTTFHEPTINYPDYAKHRCATWVSADKVKSCSEKFYSFFPSGHSFPTSPWTALYQSSSIDPTSHGLGGMYHLRADAAVTQASVDWKVEAYEDGSDTLFNATGYKDHLIKVQRPKNSWFPNAQYYFDLKLPESDYGNLNQSENGPLMVEDWTVMNTMGGVLLDMLAARRERPHRLFTGTQWIGGRAGDKVGGGGYGQYWVAVVPLVVFVGVMLRRRASALMSLRERWQPMSMAAIDSRR